MCMFGMTLSYHVAQNLSNWLSYFVFADGTQTNTLSPFSSGLFILVWSQESGAFLIK